MKSFSLATAPAAEYLDLLGKERPAHDGDRFSLRHPRMPRGQRAKLFAPFDALRGFDFAISAKTAEAQYVPRRVPDADEARELDQALSALHALTASGPLARKNRPVAAVTYFTPCADPNSDACGRLGVYETRTGPVERVDALRRFVVVAGMSLAFDRLARIELQAVEAPELP